MFEEAPGWPIESTAIGLILLFNAALGLYQEHRSEAALSRLRALAGARAWVLRDGQLVHCPTRQLVPGDVVRLEAGDRIPADGTLFDARGVMIDESILTGESVPVDKDSDAEAMSGTLLVGGKAYLAVTRTGRDSALGRLATMLGDVEASRTPLERRIDRLGRLIAYWVLGLASVLTVMGLIAEGVARAPSVIIFAVALAVAAVPEGLPAILTVALALGVERMARHRAVVRRLAAVEALGSVTIIATDKTGTLTESRMEVRSLDAADLQRALAAIVLASDADIATGVGDPLELGLLRLPLSTESTSRRFAVRTPSSPSAPSTVHGSSRALRCRRTDNRQLPERRPGGARSTAVRSVPTNVSRGERRPTPTRGKDSECSRWRGPTGKWKRGFCSWGWRCFGTRHDPKCPTPCGQPWLLAFAS